ncbi:MAG: lysophospholipid acyltransferase family protein [Endomicrobiaceae bacterium]|jgi:KDO2-lipid IV(A) lauroyltransferase|nr:lysophospholipid acyltransferase family protein [Endomicrobiaceae bacterium]MDD4166190.1 lysophospholipid acyltransferase family protein [Endomicrobiaceae bacterium]
MRKIKHYIEYISLRTVMFFLYLMPVKAAKKIGLLIAEFAFYFVPVRKKHVIESLTIAFPSKNRKEILKIAKDVYRQFVITVVEFIFFRKMTGEEIKDMYEDSDFKLMEDSLKQGKGAVLLSGHFGNWELLAKSFAQRYPTSVIVAQQSNPMVDKLMNETRTIKGFNTIYKDSLVFRAVSRALKRNEFVAILADQDAGRQGVFVPFFGRLASTAKGPAAFALRCGCPIIAAFAVRKPDGKYKTVPVEIKKPEGVEEEKAIEMIMAEYSRILQKQIEEYPSYWFWFHRRWKTKKQD